jgi:hypothetical protein
MVARFTQHRESDDGETIVQIHPPAFCIAAVAARGHWDNVRHLEGVISSPILRSDGSVLQTPGYDIITGLYYEPGGPTIDVPEAPTFEDAIAACHQLFEVVADFPFSSDAHRASWIAFILTPLARHAFQGPSPLYLIDANVRGSGKSLLADIGAIIVTGLKMPRMSCPKDDDESRKRITAIALGGDQMILIDNVSGELGGASLDAALTGTIWKDRILGRSEIVEMPLVTTWAATGSDVRLTLGVYTHVGIHDQTAAIESLPAPPVPSFGPQNETAALRATGTDGAETRTLERKTSQREVPTMVPRGAENGAERAAPQELLLAPSCTYADAEPNENGDQKFAVNPDEARTFRTKRAQSASHCTDLNGERMKVSPTRFELVTFGFGGLSVTNQNSIDFSRRFWRFAL